MTSGPGSRRDESVQFSLKELLKLEDERLEEQTREGRAREAAAARDREEAERGRRAEAEAKERAEAEAKERHRHTELDEMARREAMQKAVVEQSRLEVETRARAEERELERRHELELQRLRVEGKKGQLGTLAGASLLGGAVMLLVALGVHFGVTKPTADRRIAELSQNIVTAEGREGELGRRIEDERRANEVLQRQLGDAQNEIALLKNSAPKKPTPGPGHVPTKHDSTRPPGAAPDKVICAGPGDPLCPTIGR